MHAWWWWWRKATLYEKCCFSFVVIWKELIQADINCCLKDEKVLLFCIYVSLLWWPNVKSCLLKICYSLVVVSLLLRGQQIDVAEQKRGTLLCIYQDIKANHNNTSTKPPICNSFEFNVANFAKICFELRQTFTNLTKKKFVLSLRWYIFWISGKRKQDKVKWNEEGERQTLARVVSLFSVLLSWLSKFFCCCISSLENCNRNFVAAQEKRRETSFVCPIVLLLIYKLQFLLLLDFSGNKEKVYTRQ